jgi:hypothetical protein
VIACPELLDKLETGKHWLSTGSSRACIEAVRGDWGGAIASTPFMGSHPIGESIGPWKVCLNFRAHIIRVAQPILFL